MKMKRMHKAAAVAFMAAMMLNAPMDVSAEGVKDVFDAKYYADANEDLKAVFGYDEQALLRHYMAFGLDEGRSGSPTFNVAAYRAAYPDLEAAFGNNWDAYVNHYYKCGMTEGRNVGSVVSGSPKENVNKEETAPVTPAELSYEQQVVNLVNEERAKEGLSALKMPSYLADATGIRARELEQLYSHDRPDGRSCFSIFDDIGVSAWMSTGENIAAGYRTPSDVMNAWMNSPGHRGNIMNADFKSMGAGYWKGADGREYWVQMFTSI